MDTEIQTFNFHAATLRTLTDENEEPWFVLKDCMNILGLGNPTETVKMFDDDEFSTTEVIDSIGRRQQAYIISEPGLYRLVMKSRKLEAKEFQRWVTHEVLPSIRKHGIYATETTIDQILANPDFGIRLLTDLKNERAKRIEAENQIKELEPKAQALDAFTDVKDKLLVRDAAKILSNAGTPIGEKELREWMATHDWIYKANGSWHATAKHCTPGHLVMVMSTKHGNKPDGTTFAFPPTVRITRKGLALLHKRLSETRLHETLETTTN